MPMVKHAPAIAAGCLLMAAGTAYVADPAHLVTGGASGLAIVLEALGSRIGITLPLYFTTLFLNVPLFFYAFLRRGGRFVFGSLYATLTYSAALALCAAFPLKLSIADDLLLSALSAGALIGVGLGIVLRCGVTTGGTDMLAETWRCRRPDISAGQIINVVDTVIILLGLFVFGVIHALYAVVTVLVTTFCMDRVLNIGRGASAVFIFSQKTKELAQTLMTALHRGSTVFYAKGMYLKKDRPVLLCVVEKRQLLRLKTLVREKDAGAFLVIADVREVLGEGFSEH